MKLGEDVRISKNVEIKRPDLAIIGNHVAIDSYFYCTTGLRLGSYIHIAPHVSVVGGENAVLEMGSFTTISAGARIIARSDSFLGEGLVSTPIPSRYRDRVFGESVTMMDFSSIGTGAIVFPDVRLAYGVVVGAGAVVLKSIEEPWTIWAGNPARKIKDRPSEKMIAFAKELGYE